MEVKSFIDILKHREYGDHRTIYALASSNPSKHFYSIKTARIHGNVSTSTERKIDAECRGIIGFTSSLRNAINANKWKDISNHVGDIILNILDNSNINQLFSITPKKKHQRECFVINGGIDLLLQLFQPPFVSNIDARKFTAMEVTRKSEVWNEILVILREVSFAIPSLSDKIFHKKHIVFLFTMLHHQSVFDNTMNLLEEILATREDTFQLSLIPNFYSLIGKFTARQLSHFCRVLSLLLFEPEDRLVMEGSAVLHSTELLHLRRNRMAKNCNGIVERNQSLIIDTPNLLQRLVQVLQVINFGPNLADLISHNIVSQMPITSDILTFFSSTLGITDWDHFSNLERIVEEDQERTTTPVTVPTAATASTSNSRRSRGDSSRRSHNNNNNNNNRNLTSRGGLDDVDDITAELLSSFSPNSNSGNANQRVMDLTNIVNVMQVARDLGIADMTPLGEALLTSHPLSPRANSHLNHQHQQRRHGNNNSSQNRLLDIGPKRAKKELQFHAMLLSPHQIELIFVLCTLLSGRRKINIQQQLAALGLDKVLHKMFARMSWNTSSSSQNNSPNPSSTEQQQHIHGPGCECDPESALRVQFLRLVHNFFDRDFLGNENKLLMLSSSEINFINQKLTNKIRNKNTIPSLQYNKLVDKNEIGLLGKIIMILLNEPTDSIYRFWLSACIENFLRGCGYMGQIMVAQTGILTSTLKYITQSPTDMNVINFKCNSSLQTSFDLLGEVIRCNEYVLELLNASLTNEEFNRFVCVVMNNLVDSNVFIRSLFFSIDMISYSYQSDDSSRDVLHDFGYLVNSLNITNKQLTINPTSSVDNKDSSFNNYNNNNNNNCRPATDGYLTSSWVQFNPIIVSQKAIDLYKYSKQTYYQKENKNRTIQVKVDTKVTGKVKKNPTTTNSSSSSSLSTGEKFFKDIRKATKHLLRFGDNVKDSGANVKENNHILVPPSRDDHKLYADTVDTEFMNDVLRQITSSSSSTAAISTNTPKPDEYYTPPEQPRHHPRSSSSSTVAVSNNNNNNKNDNNNNNNNTNNNNKNSNNKNNAMHTSIHKLPLEDEINNSIGIMTAPYTSSNTKESHSKDNFNEKEEDPTNLYMHISNSKNNPTPVYQHKSNIHVTTSSRIKNEITSTSPSNSISK